MDTRYRERIAIEGILLDEPAMWMDSVTLMQNGRLILTKKRLAFMLNGAPKAAIQLDLDTINTLAHESLLTDPNILAITYLQYQSVKFSVSHFDAWEKAIEDARMTPHISMQ